MTKNFNRLRAKMSPKSRARAEAKARAMLAEMPLHELRTARKLTQTALAEQLDTNQPGVSKIERQADMYVSTLRKYVAACGGELEIVAHFPDGDVKISQFGSGPLTSRAGDED